MGILPGFAPFIVFFILLRAASVEVALWAAAGVAMLTAGRDVLLGNSVKIMELGVIGLFATIGILTWGAKASWTIDSVRLAVDCGFLVMVLLSLAIDRPFTLQYARERVPEELWQVPLFTAINRTITWGWAGAFAVLAVTDLAMVFAPDVPRWVEIAATVVALVAAFKFTSWYPSHASRLARIAP